MAARVVWFGELHYVGCHEAMNQPENLLDPLDQFYLASGMPVPEATKIEGKGIPEPYRSLLVHEDDMTPTLEAAYRQRIHLRLLNRKVEDDVMLRQVVLVLDSNERPVEFGAIRIQLRYLPPEARQLVLEGRLPLGRVLQDFFIQHSSCPVVYFEVRADALIGEALQTRSFQRLYGRRNWLLMPSGEVLAEVVEILPPSDRIPK
jgi:chorismate-pyruvate lyase